jgi:hypothetical protein
VSQQQQECQSISVISAAAVTAASPQLLAAIQNIAAAPPPTAAMSSSEGRTILLAVDDTDACQLMLQWVLDSDMLLPGDKLHLLHVTMRDATGSNHLPGADYFEQVRCVVYAFMV